MEIQLVLWWAVLSVMWTLLFAIGLSWIDRRDMFRELHILAVGILWLLFLACYGASLVLVSSWLAD